MVPEADPRGFAAPAARNDADGIDRAIASMREVAEIEISTALEYAHARAAALIAEAEAEAESILAAARFGAAPPPAGALELTVVPPPPRPAAWSVPLEAVLPMVALVLVLLVALAWMG